MNTPTTSRGPLGQQFLEQRGRSSASAPKRVENATLPPYIVFFDSECVMCNGVVKWLYANDEGNVLHYGSLHGETASALRAEHPDFPKETDTFVFWDDGTPRVRSHAAFHVATHLGYPWALGYLLRVIPRFISDGVYDYVAKNRFQWFGRTETCWLPPPAARQRFLD